ncbi:HLH-domain-containing protein [Metschnikowia bicuspidata]|uniref:HLH-domain-containing protein n=1 Tax=Metschnikowia bicuspidata TaxID=27322 RepID=A0A4P9ZG48_9ASCO|nr:HLH-domain-containing protein [Metschnikowia bicuspidata]
MSSFFGEKNATPSMRPYEDNVVDQELQPVLTPNPESHLFHANPASALTPSFNSFSFNTYNNACPDTLNDMKDMAGLPVVSMPPADHLSPANQVYANVPLNQTRDPPALINEYGLPFDVPANVWPQQNGLAPMGDQMPYSTFLVQPRPEQAPPPMAKELAYPELQKLKRYLQELAYAHPAMSVKRESPNAVKMESPTESGDDYFKKANCKTRSAHNIIEQRYRNRMNDKFTALQNCVPTLRAALKRVSKARHDIETDVEKDEYAMSDERDEYEDLEGLAPATKLNKATILTKSVEYIKFLEKKNNRMRAEHRKLLQWAKMLGISLSDDILLCDPVTDNRGNDEGS